MLTASTTVLDRIDLQATEHPKKIAVIDGHRQTSYAELAAEVDRRTCLLAARGVQPGQFLGIAIERSLNMICWVLAVLKAGAAYVPLDPTYPAERLRFVVEDAGLQMAVIDVVDAPWAADLPLTVIPGTLVAGDSTPHLAPPLTGRARADLPAYIIYTSGSTGKPKGVEVSHAALAHFVQVAEETLGIRADDVWMLTASLSYALQVRQLMTPLCVGATIAVASTDAMRDPLVLMEAVKVYGATLMDFVPSYWRTCNRILAALPAEERARLLDNRLRQVVSVGEPLTGDLVHTWRQGFDHQARIVNILGQTETTGMFTAYVVPPTTTPEEGVIPVGQPVRDVVLEMRGDSGQPVADGEVGELYISTPSLARGYWNQPDLTAQRFLCPPDGTVTGGRVYRTGDLARRRADGNLEYLGRVDQQVKVRGKRVDLVEVEAYLRQVPGVTDAAVASRVPAQDETILEAVVTAVPGAQLTLQGIWAHLRRTLPEHALPATVYCADVLPYLPNGKLDRRRAFSASNLDAVLPVGMPPDVWHGADGRNWHTTLPCFAQPCTEEQAACTPCPSGVDVSLTALLLDTMATVLKVPSVAPDDDFFVLGGHSLQAAILAMRVGQATGRRIPVELIYAAPTAVRLATALGALAGDTDAGATLVPLRPEGEHPPFFLVHGLGGGVVGYADLVLHLPRGWPVYGLRAAGTEGESAPDETIEAMAGRYLAAVRALQPTGPYRLGGYCYGGVVAFEMARQLAAEGEPPALVAIIEGFAPGWKHGRSPLLHPDRLRLVAGSLPFWWEEYRTLGGDTLRRRLAKKLRLPRPSASTGDGKYVTLAQEIVDDDLSVLPAFRQRLLDIHLHAIRNYAPAPYPGAVTLFRAQGRTVSQVLTGPLDDDLGWRRAAASVDIHTVPGAHRNLHLMPYAPSLAIALASVIDRPVG